MFQPKNVSGNLGANFTPNTTLPNSYGRVRTLKEDFENFRTGKTVSNPDTAEPPAPQETASIPVQPLQQEATPEALPKAEPQHIAPQPNPASALPKNIQPAPIPKAEPAAQMPSPFGAENFFQTKSPFSDEGITAKQEQKKPEKKRSGKLIIFLSLTLLLIIVAGGFYYWWFFLKGPSAANTDKSSPSPVPNSQSQNVPEEDQTMRNWKLDANSDKIAAKLSIDRYVQSFISSAPENKLIEVKIVSEDGQPIKYENFKDLFSFQLPQPLTNGLTSEYSLFVTKEGNLPRMGAAFKLLPSAADFQALQDSEPSIAENLSSFYLNNASVSAVGAYSSSKYKNADIRYFNFPGSSNYSMDYTMVSDNSSKYFVFSTSKSSMRAILDYMSEK